MKYREVLEETEKQITELAGHDLSVFEEVKLENQVWTGDTVVTLWGRAGIGTASLLLAVKDWRTTDGWSSTEIEKNRFTIKINLKN